MGATPPLSNPRPDRWLPAPAGVRDWVEALSRSVAERPRPILHPAVRALADLIDKQFDED